MTLCVLPTHRTQDDAEPGAYTCQPCRMHLVRQLAEIEDYLAIVSPVSGRGAPGPHAKGYRSTPPLRLDVVAMFDPRTEINGDGPDDVMDEVPNIWADIDGWTRVLLAENPDIVTPTWWPNATSNAIVGQFAALLRSRCDWICRQAWVDEFARDVARVHGALRQACGDAPTSFARCPQVVDGAECGGRLLMSNAGDRAQCPRCRAIWRRDQLLDLADRVAPPQPAYERATNPRVYDRAAILDQAMRIKAERETKSVVYYMRIGDRVKIGTTIDLDRRVREIRPEEVMATEPGGVEVERQRHGQYGHFRTTGEWFRLHGSLREHINTLREVASGGRAAG